jgi:hypothetical protein
MLPDLLFPTALLLTSLLFLFHGLVLLMAPEKCVPTSVWGQPTIKPARKQPIQFGKRFAGFCLTVAILWMFTVPVISWILRLFSARGVATPSSLRGTVLVGYFMFARPKKWVEALFALDKERLQDVATRRLWTLYIQVAGLNFAAFSLLTFSQFVRSLR